MSTPTQHAFTDNQAKSNLLDGYPFLTAIKAVDLTRIAEPLNAVAEGTHIVHIPDGNDEQPSTTRFCKIGYGTRTVGDNQKMLIINESGLYSVILHSRKAEGKRWIIQEVIPAIYLRGLCLWGYMLKRNGLVAEAVA